jgi:putative Holliday junction resolvase
MRVLGIDFGLRRIGLALSDATRTLATPLAVRVRDRRIDKDIAFLHSLIAEHDVGEIVIGLPLHMNGSAGEMAERATAFAACLKEATGIPVSTVDERLSTQTAAARMIDAGLRRKKRRLLSDSAAAAVILQTFLDRRAPAPGATDEEPDARTSSLLASDSRESLRRPGS